MEKEALQRNIPLTIIEDSREKPQAVLKINNYFTQIGARVIRSKMYVGDYQFMCNPYLVIDRKQNLNELCNNVVQDHKRFTDELKRAAEVGIFVVVLVEHGSGIKCLDDVQKWENPRLKESSLAVSGERLYKILKSMEYCYHVRFEFCNKAQTGRRIVEILTEGLNGCKRPVS